MPGLLSLLGLAGTATAGLTAHWMAPGLIAVSGILLGRSFYALYVQRRGSRASKVIAWISTGFVVGFWTLRLM